MVWGCRLALQVINYQESPPVEKEKLLSYLTTWRSRINRSLEEHFRDKGERFPQLKTAMTYSLLSGGKRIRPILTVACCEMFGSDGEHALPFACAVEMIHTFSLIHDDLPCMDNDDLRRGQPTNHKVYGEDIAVLAGDALHTECYALLTSKPARQAASDTTIVDIIALLTETVGMDGMAGGQSLDLKLSPEENKVEMLDFINLQKTARFIAASCRIGAMVAGAGEQDLQRLHEYGVKIGKAFQIVDDILDITGDQNQTGKLSVREDHDERIIYPKLLGVDGCRTLASELVDEAKATLAPYGEKADILVGIADFLLVRKH